MGYQLLQTATKNGGGYVNSTVLEFDNPVSQDSVIIVWVGHNFEPSVRSITDTNNNRYIKIGSGGALDQRGGTLFYALNRLESESLDLTIQMPQDVFDDLVVIAREYSGININNPLDVRGVYRDREYIANKKLATSGKSRRYDNLVIATFCGSIRDIDYVYSEEYENQVDIGGFDLFTRGTMAEKPSRGGTTEEATITASGTAGVGVIAVFNVVAPQAAKKYFYKFRDIEGNYQSSFRDEGFDVRTEPNFSWRINGGKGIMRIDIDAELNSFSQWAKTNSVDSIECIVYDSNSSRKGEILFAGKLLDAQFAIDENGHGNLDGYSYGSAEYDLAKKQIEDISGNTRLSYSDMDFSDIYKDLIDKYQIQGDFVSYLPESVDTVGIPISITFKNESFLEGMQRLSGYLPRGWYWYLDGQGVFYLKRTNLLKPDHRLFIGKEINKSYFKVSYADIVNKVYYNGGDTGSGYLYRLKALQSSINRYGIRSERISDERVTNNSTADLRIDQIIANKSVPVRYIEFVVQDDNHNQFGYDIESLKPGDSIQVLHPSISTDFTRYQNPEGTVGNAVYNESFYNYDINASIGAPFQIQEIEYNGRSAVIRSSDILTNQARTIRQLEKQQLTQATINSPDSPEE